MDPFGHAQIQVPLNPSIYRQHPTLAFSLAGQKIERLECLSLAVCQLNGRLAGLISGQIPTLWFLGRSNLPAF
jgi:hypothetical protein